MVSCGPKTVEVLVENSQPTEKSENTKQDKVS